MRQGTLAVAGTKITYYDSGAPGTATGPAVVLLHGTGGSAYNNFWALFPMLAMRHRVIAFDFVDPEDPAQVAETAHYTAQATAVIEHLSPDEPVNLVGYSFGAVIAAALGAERADLVENLVLVAGWARTDIQQRLRNDIWQSLRLDRHPALPGFMVLTAYSDAYLAARTETELAEIVSRTASGPDRLSKMLFNRAVDISEQIPRISSPTLVIGCAQDQMVPVRHARMLFGGIPDARYAEVGSGHAVVHERPAELFTLIDAFVKDPAKTRAGAVLSTGHA
ncbi:alpha/beta fold hydrolase [Actinacidiphila sp. ITFR-21]|uniref:alpha/beta fold hydrolase n=1 Tax=Actinacidiphila sp. ITFR-21 TaxID=3075199 RepID=UPI00288B9763|nr:alpha/beta hydrolase [Streptomyces sp. ITFR-21]WNI14264.1 alpha/beta hydrolase [Streptomyces sp. ITFR-21]